MRTPSRWTSGRIALVSLALAAGLLSATGVASADPEVLLSTDFEDGTYAPWTASGAPGLSVVDIDGGQALLVSDRTNDYDGIQAPTGLLRPGGAYTFTGRARLAAGTAGSADVRFVVKPDYTWVGNTTMTADAWTTVTGTFTAPAGADPGAVQVYVGTAETGAPYSYLLDDLEITGTGPGGDGEEVLRTDFEAGLDGWVPRSDGAGDPVVATTTAEAHGGAQAALVSGRSSQGDGIGRDVTSVLEPGGTYRVSAWVRFGEGAPPAAVWMSVSRTAGGSTSFDTLAQLPAATSTGWTEITGTYQPPVTETAFLYLETAYPDGVRSDLLVDDVTITSQSAPPVEDLTPLQDSIDVPVGVAIDSRETTGGPEELLTRHFGQVTPENHFKPSYWYDAERRFAIHPEAVAVMDLATRRDLRVHGHTLVWHQQSPDWFFSAPGGAPLTTSEADQQLLRDRLRTHVFSVAEALSTGGGYGEFGTAGNPVVSFDVVNEVVSDGTEGADGLRRSEWYRVLGEEYIDLAFQYADEAFNGTYAAQRADRPVTLFINDYNTELPDKRARLKALVARLLDRGVPVDGVGHQFHVTLATPVSALDAALADLGELPVTQAVTELDVATGAPATDGKLVEQGYWFRDAFRVLRAHEDHLFSITLWGLTDGRSWRVAEGAPLMFDDRLQAKPAYVGAVDGELPARKEGALSFQGEIPLDPPGAASAEWARLSLERIGDLAGFQTRWQPDHLSVLVQVDDTTAQDADAAVLTLDGQDVTVPRAGAPGAVVSEIDGGWTALVRLPLTAAAVDQVLDLDARVTDGDRTERWGGDEFRGGELTLAEQLTFAQVPEAAAAPVVDGQVDDAWVVARPFSPSRLVEGTVAATAQVRTVWRDGTLYLLAEVRDATIDLAASDPWQQDSVELFVDPGNAKNGAYRPQDSQIRISADNVVSFGAGDQADQQARLRSATTRTDGGYVVEVSVDLAGAGTAGSFQGLDVQLNDAAGGRRTSVQTWADPTGTGYQTTARWGVLELVPAPEPPAPEVGADARRLRTGSPVVVTVSGFAPGSSVPVQLRSRRSDDRPWSVPLGPVTVGADGTGTRTFTVPRSARPGAALLLARDGDRRATYWVTVVRAGRGGSPS